jgi:uncharacterized protein (TIGR00369 family)
VTRRFPGLLGLRVVERRHGYARAELAAGEKHLRPRGQGLHAGAIVSLADTACGAGTTASIPADKGFSTLELKANFLAAAQPGTLVAEASPLHMGGRTHVWEARVSDADGRLLALFSCTQMIVDARP